jgi:hypothetical protein
MHPSELVRSGRAFTLCRVTMTFILIGACGKNQTDDQAHAVASPSEKCTAAAKAFAKMFLRCAPNTTYDQGFNTFVDQFVDAGNYSHRMDPVRGCAAVKYVDEAVLAECVAQFERIDCKHGHRNSMPSQPIAVD